MKETILKSISEFATLDKAVIDTSSIIYMHKIEIFELLSKQIDLLVSEEVISELGYHPDSIEIIDFNKKLAQSTDNIIVETAKWYNYTIISEDKAILQQAGQANLPYFNTLMMINFLFYKKKISEKKYLDYLNKLKATAHYSSKVWEFGQMVYEEIIEEK